MACCGMSPKRIVVPPINNLTPEQESDIKAVEASQLVRKAYPTAVTRKSEVVPRVVKPKTSPIIP